jgi:hypothetical protein
MLSDELKKRTTRYVLERQCRGGGFCFYKLEEPSGLDTYSALCVLNLLNVPFQDEKTVSYLRNMQGKDGSYDSVFAAYYSLKSLLLLNEAPQRDPWPYILKHVRQDRVDAEKLPAEITSVFRRMAFLIDLYCTFKRDSNGSAENHFKAFILHFHNNDNGFGYRQSTLGETSRALFMLSRLAYPVQTLRAETFISRCETPGYGFTDIPDTSLSYLEYAHAGILASVITGYKLRYPDQCSDFIRYCQTKTGGFSRVTHGGIATLEDTCYAVHALKLLSML